MLPRVVTEAAANTFYLAEFMIGSATKISKPLGALVQREKLKEREGDKDRKSVLWLAAPAPQARKGRLCWSWWGGSCLALVQAWLEAGRKLCTPRTRLAPQINCIPTVQLQIKEVRAGEKRNDPEAPWTS